MYGNQMDKFTTTEHGTVAERELEASVLARAGYMLQQVRENWNGPDRNEKLLEAIRFNQKVWSFFQAELSDPENPLPQNLRQDILNLSLFVDKRLLEVMVNPDRDKLQIIVDINFNIAAGLKTKAG